MKECWCTCSTEPSRSVHRVLRSLANLGTSGNLCLFSEFFLSLIGSARSLSVHTPSYFIGPSKTAEKNVDTQGILKNLVWKTGKVKDFL